jgi:hypothetical protein
MKQFWYKLYSKLPFNARVITKLIYIFFIKNINKLYLTDSFPIVSPHKTFFNSPLFPKEEGYGYYAQYYHEKSVSNFVINPTDWLNYKTEILYGYSVEKNFVYKSYIGERSLLPVSIVNNKLTNEQNDKFKIKLKVDNKEYLLKNCAQNRFYYLPINTLGDVELSCEFPTIIGKPIPVVQNRKNSKKLVLNIFIDGLASEAFKNKDLQTLMPNCYNYFKDDFITLNGHINADWTISSVPTLMSGLHSIKHGVFSRSDSCSLGKGYKLISELFQDSDYLTTQICSNYGKPPSMGYVKGFDKTIYQRSMSVDNVVNAFLEHLRAFDKRDNYVWLSIMDLHHFLDIVPAVSTQSKLDLMNCDYQDRKKKSVVPGKDLKRVARYVEELKRIDFYLNIIFNYISSSYNKDEVVVALCSDHGQSYFTDDEMLFSEQRTMVPMMIKGTIEKHGMTNFRVDNIDFLPTILSLSDIKYNKNDFDGVFPASLGGDDERNLSLAESIYPGKTYKAVITDHKNRFYFETKSLVNQDGSFQIEDYNVKIINRLTHKDETKLLSEQAEFFTKMIVKHVAHSKMNHGK